MIGKVTTGSRPNGILNYCYYEKAELSEKEKVGIGDVRGEVIYAQNLAFDSHEDGRYNMDYLAQQFKDCAAMNSKLKDYIWHQSFSFPTHENPTNEQLEKLTVAFSKDFGFEDNQLVAFKHTDKAHPHIHIVGNRINATGETTAKDSYSKLRTGDFCRKMELELGLSITPNMKSLQSKEEKSVEFSRSKVADSIRSKIDRHISTSKNLEELKRGLKKEEIKMYQGRGVSFVDEKSGAKFKGSELGREYSLMNLESKVQAPEKQGKQESIEQVQVKNEVSQKGNALDAISGIDTSKVLEKSKLEKKDKRVNKPRSKPKSNSRKRKRFKGR